MPDPGPRSPGKRFKRNRPPDRRNGQLWRSEDLGATWSDGPLFTIPASDRDFNGGWIAADPNAVGESVVWLSGNGTTGLHKLSCVATCQEPASWTDKVITDVPIAGPVAMAPCTAPCTSVLYVSTQVVDGDITQPALYKSTPDGSFCKLTVDTDLWAGAGGFPVQLALASDGVTVRALLATVGNGLIIGTDGTGTSCEGA